MGDIYDSNGVDAKLIAFVSDLVSVLNSGEQLNKRYGGVHRVKNNVITALSNNMIFTRGHLQMFDGADWERFASISGEKIPLGVMVALKCCIKNDMDIPDFQEHYEICS